jgi:ribosomal 30S subunit maturation factor RimM
MYLDLFSDHPLRTGKGQKLWAAGTWYEIAASKKSTDRWLMYFVGVTDRNVVERLTNSDVYGEPIDDPSVVWVHELVGSVVVDTAGNNLGTCTGVIDNPAHPIMELDNGFLVPTPFIVSNENGQVEIDAPEGLFDAD